jgi:hypothetical protein
MHFQIAIVCVIHEKKPWLGRCVEALLVFILKESSWTLLENIHIPKMKTLPFFEMSIAIHELKQRNSPEDLNVLQNRCNKLLLSY